MKRYEKFGETLQNLRSKSGQSITDVARSVGIDRTHLSKLENGHERPSIDILNNLIRHYSLSAAEASQLAGFADYRQGLIVEQQGGKEGNNMQENTDNPTSPAQPGVQINIPGNLPVLYTDSVFVGTNQFGLVFDFAQSMGSTNQQTVVARLGMSKEHAKALLKVLAEKLHEDKLLNELTKN